MNKKNNQKLFFAYSFIKKSKLEIILKKYQKRNRNGNGYKNWCD